MLVYSPDQTTPNRLDGMFIYLSIRNYLLLVCTMTKALINYYFCPLLLKCSSENHGLGVFRFLGQSQYCCMPLYLFVCLFSSAAGIQSAKSLFLNAHVCFTLITHICNRSAEIASVYAPSLHIYDLKCWSMRSNVLMWLVTGLWRYESGKIQTGFGKLQFIETILIRPQGDSSHNF